MEKFQTFGLDENATLTAKVNSIVQALNQVGRVSNNVVHDWQKVMEWAMGEGLDEATNKEIESLIAGGRFEEMISLALTEFNGRVDSVETSLIQNTNNLGTRGINFLSPPSPLVGAKGDNTTDDTIAIQTLINHCSTNGLQPYFPRKSYKITSTVIIPSGCKVIDFNFATFNYYGASGTYCISGGSTDGVTGGYTNATWKNLYINCQSTNNGMDVSRIRSSYFENFYIYGANVGLNMNNSWQNMFNYFYVNTCTTGVITGDACNAVNLNAFSVSACTLGIKLGSTGVNPAYGVVIGGGSAIQGCTTAIELNAISQASIINTYFEFNNVTFKVATNTSVAGIYAFSVENCIIDVGLSAYANLVKVYDSTRSLQMKFTNNRFQGTLTGTYFEKDVSITSFGNWSSLVFKQNNFSNAPSFTGIFPSSFHVDKVECDIPFLPTVNTTGWSVIQIPKIYCLGNSQFELVGIVAKVSGQTQGNVLSGLFAWMQPQSASLITDKFVPQTVTGVSGSLTKMAKVEIQNNQFIYIYTVDNTDTSAIYLTGTRWSIVS